MWKSKHVRMTTCENENFEAVLVFECIEGKELFAKDPRASPRARHTRA